MRKHLNPLMPSATRGRRSCYGEPFSFSQLISSLALTAFPGITPPQNPMSVQHWPFAASSFPLKFGTVVVGGLELSGMSMTVVHPPDAAA